VQELLDAIAEKYNCPHRKTNALLAGLVHCPHCGRRQHQAIYSRRFAEYAKDAQPEVLVHLSNYIFIDIFLDFF